MSITIAAIALAIIALGIIAAGLAGCSSVVLPEVDYPWNAEPWDLSVELETYAQCAAADVALATSASRMAKQLSARAAAKRQVADAERWLLCAAVYSDAREALDAVDEAERKAKLEAMRLAARALLRETTPTVPVSPADPERLYASVERAIRVAIIETVEIRGR